MLVSSHLLAEVAQSVDDVVVIAKGELRGQGTLEHVLGRAREARRPRCGRAIPTRLAAALRAHGPRSGARGRGLFVPDAAPEQIGEIALEERIALSHLAPRTRSLESAFFELTGGETVSALLRAELLKLRTTRTFAALVGSALALSLLAVSLSAALTDQFTEDEVRELFTADFTGLFIMLLGVMGMAGEWRHRTITSTVLAAPDRLRLVAAKTLSYAIAGVVLSLIVTVSIMVVGSLILSGRGLDTLGAADLADVLWRNLLVAALAAVIGVCVGGIVRNQVVAIVGLLVFAFVLEPTLLA